MKDGTRIYAPDDHTGKYGQFKWRRVVKLIIFYYNIIILEILKYEFYNI